MSENLNQINLEGINIKPSKKYPIYRLLEGGDLVLIETHESKFKKLKPHHIGPDGMLCDDLETFIKWDMFS